jgi:uncharacterized membrane protein YfcA
MIAVTVVLAVFVGISLGLLGGGGSILTVPLLAYVAGMDPKQAIATSLLVVGVTSAVGAITHARAGRVRWRTAALFGVAAMAGAYAGGRLARFVPGTVLMVVFALVMVAAAVAMLRGRQNTTASDTDRHLPMLKIAVLGVAVGTVSGLVGAGGGFLLVPALALLGGLPMPAAIGTSLVVIAMQSVTGLAGHLAAEHIDWQLAGMVTAAAVVGAVVGGRLTGLVDANALRRLFGWFVLLMASLILAEETTAAIGVAAAALTAIAAVAYVMCSRTTHCPLRRFAGQPHISAATT